MTPEERLAALAGELSAAGLESLVMGGHALRYYGVDRNTIDFDFCTAVASIQEIRTRLARSSALKAAREGPSWRPDDFARFEIGRLPDGREEWLEFWVRNHLLPVFTELRSRQERGLYGGKEVAFLGLSDLMRSKETEREGDWQDLALLEEIRDARNMARAIDRNAVEILCSELRSRRGFIRAKTANLLEGRDVVERALGRTGHPITFAFLAPLVPDAPPPQGIDAAVLQPLRAAQFGSSAHLALVEVVRRAYKRRAMEIDRLDKQSRLSGQ